MGAVHHVLQRIINKFHISRSRFIRQRTKVGHALYRGREGVDCRQNVKQKVPATQDTGIPTAQCALHWTHLCIRDAYTRVPGDQLACILQGGIHLSVTICAKKFSTQATPGVNH